MPPVNLRNIDLNLLVSLDALLEERKVVAAARRLGITQPSASAALERCRVVFADPLLVRAGKGMRLTNRAEALRGPIRAVLDEAQSLFEDGPTGIAQMERTLRIITSDIPALSVMDGLWKEFRIMAPGIRLVLLLWRDSDSVVDALARGDADLALTVLPEPRNECRRTLLHREDYKIAMRSNHPALIDFDLDRWLAFPHILVSATGARRSALDDQIGVLGRSRQVAITVPSFLMVAPLLAESDLIALLPSSCRFPGADLVYVDPPIPIEGFPLHLVWAARSDKDLVVQAAATVIREVISRLVAKD